VGCSWMMIRRERTGISIPCMAVADGDEELMGLSGFRRGPRHPRYVKWRVIHCSASVLLRDAVRANGG
jgi:hypothetical protein